MSKFNSRGFFIIVICIDLRQWHGGAPIRQCHATHYCRQEHCQANAFLTNHLIAPFSSVFFRG